MRLSLYGGKHSENNFKFFAAKLFVELQWNTGAYMYGVIHLS
jgi:hypothetical protein